MDLSCENMFVAIYTTSSFSSAILKEFTRVVGDTPWCNGP